MLRAYSDHRYAVLFYTLLATLAAGPLLESAGLSAGVLEGLLALNLVAAVAPIARGGQRRLLVALVAAVVFTRGLAARLEVESVSTMAFDVWTIIGLTAAASAFRFALRARTVDSEHLYAALDAYLLVGVFLGVFFWTLERQAPGSLDYAAAASSTFSAADGIYFSFVTLGTLGCGDITLRSDAARGVAIVEAVAGQLYLAVLVSRLVSLQINA